MPEAVLVEAVLPTPVLPTPVLPTAVLPAAVRVRREGTWPLMPYPTSTAAPAPEPVSPAADSVEILLAVSVPPAEASVGGSAVAAPDDTVMIGVPTSTVSPSLTRMAVTVPAKGDGSSTSDFAVSISTSTWLTVITSPGLTFQATISASVSPSPTSGRVNSELVTTVLFEGR